MSTELDHRHTVVQCYLLLQENETFFSLVNYYTSNIFLKLLCFYVTYLMWYRSSLITYILILCCGDVYICMCAHGVQTTLGCFSGTFHLIYHRDFHWPGILARTGIQPCLPPSTGITNIHPHAWHIFPMVPVIWTEVFMLVKQTCYWLSRLPAPPLLLYCDLIIILETSIFKPINGKFICKKYPSVSTD